MCGGARGQQMEGQAEETPAGPREMGSRRRVGVVGSRRGMEE